MNKQKGFTLIEILIIIAIISILASILVVNIKKAVEDKPENSNCETYWNTNLEDIKDVPDKCIQYYQNK